MKLLKYLILFVIGGPLYLLGYIFGLFLVPILNGVEDAKKFINKILR